MALKFEINTINMTILTEVITAGNCNRVITYKFMGKKYSWCDWNRMVKSEYLCGASLAVCEYCQSPELVNEVLLSLVSQLTFLSEKY